MTVERHPSSPPLAPLCSASSQSASLTPSVSPLRDAAPSVESECPSCKLVQPRSSFSSAQLVRYKLLAVCKTCAARRTEPSGVTAKGDSAVSPLSSPSIAPASCRSTGLVGVLRPPPMVTCCRSIPELKYPPTIQASVFHEVQRAGDLALAELQLLLPEYSEVQLLEALKRLKKSRHVMSYSQPSRIAPEDPDAECVHWAVQPAANTSEGLRSTRLSGIPRPPPMVTCCRTPPECTYPPTIQASVFREVQRAGDLAGGADAVVAGFQRVSVVWGPEATQEQRSSDELRATITSRAGRARCRLHALGRAASNEGGPHARSVKSR